jgi:hypothetical protein
VDLCFGMKLYNHNANSRGFLDCIISFPGPVSCTTTETEIKSLYL